MKDSKYFEIIKMKTKICVVYKITGDVGFATIENGDTNEAIHEAIHNIMIKFYDQMTNDVTKP